MLGPKCGFCNGTSFKIAQPAFDVQGAQYKMPFVVCANCRATVAVLSQYDPGVAAKSAEAKVDDLAKEVNRLGSVLNTVRADLAQVMSHLQRIKS